MADELGSTSVSIKVDLSQLEIGLSKARAEVAKFDKEVNKAITISPKVDTKPLDAGINKVGADVKQIVDVFGRPLVLTPKIDTKPLDSGIVSAVTAVDKFDEKIDKPIVVSPKVDTKPLETDIVNAVSSVETFEDIIDKPLVVAPQVDSKPLDTGLGEATDAIDKFDKEAGKAATGGVDKLGKKVKQTDKDIDSLGKSIGDASNKLSALPGPIGGIAGSLGGITGAATVAAAAVAALTAVFVGLAVVFKASTDAAEEWERNTLKTNAILKATGFSAGLTAKQIKSLTDAIKVNTLATESSVISASQKLLTFRSVQGDTFREGLRLAQDLAAVGFGSIESSATRLGRALEDPVNGLNAFTRVGVKFSPVQKEIIKNLVETGRLAEAQGIILDTLAGKVGGAGEAEASGLSGAYHRLSVSVADFLENIGKNGPLQATTVVINALTSAIQFLNDALFDTEQSVDVLGTLGKGLAGFGPLGVLASNGISAFSASLRENNDEIRDRLLLESEEQKRAAAKGQIAAAEIEAERKQGIAMEAAKKSQEAAAAAAKSLAEQRQQTIGALGEEVRVLGELSNLYIGTSMSAAQLATTGEILRTQAMLRVAANSAEGESISTLITKRDELQASIDKETESRAALKQETEATLEFRAALQDTIDARKRAIDIDVAAIGMGQRRADLQREINEIEFEYAKRLEETARAQGTSAALTEQAYKARVEALRKAQEEEIAIIEEGEKRKQEARASGAKGAQKAFEDYAAEANDLAGQVENLTKNALQKTEDALVDFAKTGKLSFTDLADSIINDLLRIGAKLIVADIAGALFGMGGNAGAGAGSGGNLGGLASIGATLFHDGGTVGQGGQPISVPAATFINAPRFHNGLKPDEFPAILQQGEEVVPKDKVGNRGGVTNINNWNINAPDPNAFRASQRQINRAAAARVQTR